MTVKNQIKSNLLCKSNKELNKNVFLYTILLSTNCASVGGKKVLIVVDMFNIINFR